MNRTAISPGAGRSSRHAVDSGRRALLRAAALAPLLSLPAWAHDAGVPRARYRLADLERSFDGRLGLCAIDTADGARLTYRAHQPFPVCSTFKVLLAAAVLERDIHAPALLARRIHYGAADMVAYAPITQHHLADGMTVGELVDALLRYSDNVAANLLMRLIGGPAAVTAYAHGIGNQSFRLDSWEPNLNAAPDGPRDTATPEAMAHCLQQLVLGEELPSPQRMQLRAGLTGSVTGASLIRAGVPPGWLVGDKSGASAAFGTRNDIAVLWPSEGAPVVLAVYTTRHARDATMRDDVVAAASRIATEWIRERR
ncbi:class A beta-lactamase [Pseudoduganella sp. R-34]|uniref:class A beta-lactamase n=1 Tax=unclassified Pseudoduganella TaxID=2637179 RepID=UPI003CF1A3E4